MIQAIGTRSTSGDGGAVVAAPGSGLRVVIVYWRVQLEADGDQTVLLKSGSTTIGRFFGDTAAHGIIEDLTPGRQGSNRDTVIYCGENEAVYVNLSAAVQINYTIKYYVDGA